MPDCDAMTVGELASPAMVFVSAAKQALCGEGNSSISDADLEAVLTSAVKLYAARVQQTNNRHAPISADGVTATEVVIVASEMMRVVDLNPFDLSMWFGRAR